MTDTSYTLGPWVVDDFNAIRADRCEDRECVLIAEYTNAPMGLDYNNARTRPIELGEAKANAHIIAAAPEMLVALERALRTDGNFVGWEKLARAAVAKAKGKDYEK